MANRKRKKGRRNQQTTNIDLHLIGTIIFSVLLAILIYTNSGTLGNWLNEALGGMMGILRYILPIGTFAIAIKIACKEDEEVITQKLVQYAIMLISVAVVMSIYQVSKGNIEITGEMSQILKNAYELGADNTGGGVIGTLAAVPLVRLLGNLGAVVLSIGISIILFAFVFGIDISEIISQKIEEIIENQEERKIDREEKKKELAEYRETQKQEMQEKRKELAERREKAVAEEKQRIRETKANKRKAELQTFQEEMLEPEQIQINLNGRIIEEEQRDENRFKNAKAQLLNGRTNNVAETANSIMSEDEALFKKEEEQKQDKTKQVLQLEHTQSTEIEEQNYVYPPTKILTKPSKSALKGGTKALTETANKLQKTLYSFGVSAKVENVTLGPAITRYELKPAEGVRVSKIANLADDIALNLAAETIRIEAPIPGKQAVGIEVPNKEKEMVVLREVIESQEFVNNKSKLSVALGKDVSGKAVVADIAKMPHVLIAGSTGSGKSVCINTIITSIIYNSKPSEVKLVMVDPKVVELSVYNGIPHLLIPVVTDPKKAAGALAWAVQEMDNRYNLFAEKGVRDLKGYNKVVEKEEGKGQLPQILVIIDELADLMMVAAKDVEEAICRLAQKARAAGMHLVIATQRPSVDVITGLIKANVPSRIAFAVSSQIDSRTILDQVGAEKLLGKGDMLFFPSGASKPTRVQGAYVSDEEVEQIVEFVKSNGTATYSEDILETIENGNKQEKGKALEAEQAEDDATDPFLNDAIDVVVETGQASTSFIQRRFKVGYARAGRIIDQMEERGVISGYQGSKPREVLWTLEKLAELKMKGDASLKAKKDKLIGKIVKTDYNNILEEILEQKKYSEEAKSLLLSMIYKIETAYKDYEKVKKNVLEKEKYIQNIFNIIKKDIEKIKFIKEHEVIINKAEKEIKCYPIERELLYAISKIQKKENIVKSKNKLIERVMSKTINIGNSINTVEPLRDFNGFSWNTVYKEIEDINYNLIYQDLIILGNYNFLENWTNNNQYVVDYVEVLQDEIELKYGAGLAEKVMELIITLSILLEIKNDKELQKELVKQKKQLKKEVKAIEDKQKYVVDLAEKKKKISRKIKKLDTILNNKQKMQEEYKKVCDKLAKKEKTISAKAFINDIKKERESLLKEMTEYNKLMNPNNYIKREEELDDILKYLKFVDTKKIDEEIFNQLIELQKYTMQCFKIKIENVKNKQEYMNLIYEFRYYYLLPIDAKKSTSQEELLKGDLQDVIKDLIKKGIELKQMVDCSKRFEVNYNILKNIFNSRIIAIEEIYIKIMKEGEKTYLQVFDGNIENEAIELNLKENNLKIKLNKKIKVFK